MNKFKKTIALLLVALMIIPSGSFSFGQETDISNHWAKEEINYLIEKGIVNGYPDGTFRPERNITRAEFYKLVNELVGYKEKAKVKFDDVKDTDWFYEHIQKGVKAKYIKEGKTLKANAKIRREEVAEILSIVFDIEENLEVAKKFKDYNSIPKALRGVFGGLADKKYLNGYPDGTVKAKSEIKRSEVAKMFYDMSGQILNLPGKYTEKADGNVLVNTADVILKDMHIKGDLNLTEGIGQGDATLDNVIVEGKTYIKGGGENSIIIINSKLGEMAVRKENSNVRIVIDENTDVSNIVIDENTILVIKKGAKVESIKVTGKARIEVEKGAQVDKIEIESKDVEVKADGKIGSVVSTEDFKTNDKVIKKGEEIIVEEGKVKLAKEDSKPTPTPTPSTGGSYESSDPTPSKVAVSGVTFNNNPIEIEKGSENLGMKVPTEANIKLSDGTTATGTLEWNPSSIDVNTAGKQTLKGKVKIPKGAKYTISEELASVELTVNVVVKVSAITVTGAEGATTVVNGKTLQMGVVIGPDDASNKKVTWSVINGTGSATIDANGLLTATGVGKVTVKAAAQDGSGKENTKEITIHADLTAYNAALAAVKEADYTADSWATYQGVVTTNVVTVINTQEQVTTATNNIIAAQADLVIPVTGISVSGDGSVAKDDTLQLTATITPDNATNPDVTWSIESGGTGSATINTDGLLTGTGVGTVTVKVVSQYDVSITATKEITITTSKLDAAKANAKGDLVTALATYTQTDYEAADWITLTGYKTNGDTAIDSAVDITAVTSAKETAINGMAGVNKKQAAPTSLAGVTPTSVANDDGKITGTTTEMEYKLQSEADTEYKDCSADTTVVGAAGEYVVRVKAKTGYNASPETVVTVNAYIASTDASVSSVKVDGITATVDTSDPKIYNVKLPAGANISTLKATDIVVIATDDKATVATATTSNSGATWTVIVTAEDGTTKITYTINVTKAENEADGFTATLVDVNATIDTEVTAAELQAGITNLPTGATTNATAFTPSAAGDVTKNIVITFSDSSTKTVTVTVKVQKKPAVDLANIVGVNQVHTNEILITSDGSNFTVTVHGSLGNNYEYSKDNGADWVELIEGSPTNIPESTSIQIRKKENFEYEAGPITEVVLDSDFVFNKRTGTIMKYIGSATDLTIPNTIDGETVKTIGYSAFNNKNLTKVTIPNSVTKIDKLAFRYNELASITIPNSVTTIGTDAFKNNRLTSITFEGEVASIEAQAFYINGAHGNFSGELSTPYEGTWIISGNKWVKDSGTDFIFEESTATITGYTGESKVVNIPATINGVNVTAIGESAFSNKALTSVTIPDTVVTIGVTAFSLNNIVTLTIGDNVTSIGISAFAQNNSLTNLVIPNKVKTISRDAFNGCWGVKSLTLGDSVETIGNYAFYNCNLASLTLGNSVKTIGEGAFQKNKLTEVTIPTSVESLGEGAFLENGEGKNTTNSPTESGTWEILDDSSEWTKKIFVTGVSLNQSTLSLAVGETATLVATVTPEGATNKKVTWTTSDNAVANVDVNGEITAVAVGTATITVTTTDGSKTATCEVTVADKVVDFKEIPGVTPPVTGATPVTTITGTDQYTGTVTWSPEDNPFAGGKVYTATITLVPKTGFKLDGVTADYFTVAGATATNLANSGVVTAVFPETELADQAAPTGLLGVAPTTEGGTDGKIMGTTVDMEYKLKSASKWNNVVGTEITNLAAGTYEVRYAAKAGYKESPATTVTVDAYVAPATLDSIAITKDADKLVYKIDESLDITGLEVTGTYSDSTTKVEEITTDNVKGFNSSAVVASQTLTITVGEKTATYTVEIQKADGPAAPLVESFKTGAPENRIMLKNDGTNFTIKVGTNKTGLQYSTNDGAKWDDLNATEEEIIIPGNSILIRAIETDTHKAGEAAKVLLSEGYVFNSNTGTIINYAGTEKDLNIPSSITIDGVDVSVTKIDRDAFRAKELTSVTIPETVITIGTNAFMNNNLASIVIPNSVTHIDTSAFEENQLTEITISDSIYQIGFNVFKNNKLTEVKIPASVQVMYDNVFQNNGTNSDSEDIQGTISEKRGKTWELVDGSNKWTVKE